MALKMRKDIKKSSYYVWFLGAQESKGLRGSEYVIPVVKSLIQRERTVEPFKVTLQVSHKGLKIIQNVPQNPQAPKSKKPEVVKHFIPHHAVTCVLQDVDIVSCILLLYNPVTKCPVHVHAYRCDSVETAEILKGQLQTLIERPENQKKLGEIETRLQAKGLLIAPNRAPAARRLNSGGGSDGRSTSTRESESSGGSSSERLSGGNQERITNLYDSLAAELREKLGSSKRAADAPILLPPRDYDTVHRQKGNLTAIDLRRCLNTNIVGVNVKKEAAKSKAAVISSGGSSGIGSDHAPSPDQADPEQRYLDNQSSSDEEWTEQPSEDSLFLVAPGSGWPRPELSLPRARRMLSNDAPSTPSTPSSNPSADALRRRPAEIRQRSPSPSRLKPKLYPLKTTKSLTTPSTIGKLSPRDRFKDAKEKFLLLERERSEEQDRLLQKAADGKKRGSIELPISPVTSGAPRLTPRSGPRWTRTNESEEDIDERPVKEYVEDCDDDIFEHGYPKKNNNAYRSRPEEDRPARRQDVVKGHQRGEDVKSTPPRGNRDNGKSPREREDEVRHIDRRMEPYGDVRRYDRPIERQYSAEHKRRDEYSSEQKRRDEYSSEQKRREQYSPENKPRREEYSPEAKGRREEFSPEAKGRREEYSPEAKGRREEYSPDRAPKQFTPEPKHPYSPDRKPRRPDDDVSPDRKPKKSPEYSPERKPRRSADYSPERVLSPTRRHDENYPGFRGSRAQVISQLEDPEPPVRYRNPLPAPRRSPEQQRQFHAQEKKRRSMFDVMEDERRRSSNELAKEFKRRSYHDGGSEISADYPRERDYRGDTNRRPAERRDPRSNSIETRNNQSNHMDSRGPRYQEIAEQERFPGLDRDTARHVPVKSVKKESRYRHSYAEPAGLPLHMHGHHDVLHRTNSSVSSGRVGIAAIHPY